MWHLQSISFLVGSFIGSVWIFHGFYSKLYNGIPRHRSIVGRILGEKHARLATRFIGVLEVGLGAWAITGRGRMLCAAIQTVGLIAMNSLEVWLAADLLISAWGMIALNVAFIALIWLWAVS